MADQQEQWTLQLYLNLADFGIDDLQAAIDAPPVHTNHMPSSFYPRVTEERSVEAEARIAAEVFTGLEARGHRVQRNAAWQHGRDPASGLVEAAASTRGRVTGAIALP